MFFIRPVRICAVLWLIPGFTSCILLFIFLKNALVTPPRSDVSHSDCQVLIVSSRIRFLIVVVVISVIGWVDGV